MTTRRALLIALGSALASPLYAPAQQPASKIHRIGLLGVTSPIGYSRQIAALHEGLRELGYIEGQNIVIESRWADGHYDRLGTLASELIKLRPDLLITSGPGVRVLKEKTVSIPIVMAVGGDPVANGIIQSLARPGGNITGSVAFNAELTAKRLELLVDSLGRMRRVAVLMNLYSSPANKAAMSHLANAAAARKIEIEEAGVRSPRDFESAFGAMRSKKVDGLVTVADSMLVANMRHLGELSLEHRIPGAGSDEYPDGGGLVAYGVNFPALWHRAAYFVDRIIKGGKPATLPVEQASRFETVVNLKTAKTLGINVPQSVLLRADRVIE